MTERINLTTREKHRWRKYSTELRNKARIHE